MTFHNLSQHGPLKRFARSDCPICGSKGRGCAYHENDDREIDLVLCIDEDAWHPDYVKGRRSRSNDAWSETTLWIPKGMERSGQPAKAETRQEQADRQARRQARLQAEADRKAGNPDGNLRHQEYSKLLKQLPEKLHPEDLADLALRGISADKARSMGIRSIGVRQPLFTRINSAIPGISSDGRSMTNAVPGYIVPIRDTSGRILGAQIRNRNLKPIDPIAAKNYAKYLWLSSAGIDGGYGPSLACDDLPLAFVKPQTPDLDRADYLGMCEGTGVKVALVADRFGIPTIGASGGNFGKSQNDFYLLDRYYKASGKKHIMLFPDAGAIFNPDVILAYSRIAEFVEWKNKQGKTAVQAQKAIDDKQQAKKYEPIELKVMWWDQFTKDQADPDELANEKPIVLDWKQFFSCTLGVERKPANAWIQSRKFTPDEIRDSRYCDFPMPEKREMLCIKASLGLGKTHRMIELIVQMDWATVVVDPTNNLCVNFNERAAKAGISADLVGNLVGQDEAVKAASSLVQIMSLCPDSITSVSIEGSAGKILVIDEANETGNAFRQRPTHIKKIRREAIEHFQALLHVVHGVVLMDGNLSDLSCRWFSDLCPSLSVRKIEYSHKNRMRFDLEVGTKDQFIANMAYRLKNTETPIIVGTDSRADTRAAEYALHAGTAKECAVDEEGNLYSEWAELLMKDPAEFVRVFSPMSVAYSPAAGSGWDCNVGDYFKENFIFGSGVLGVDGMLQTSARDRWLETIRRCWIAPIGLPDYWTIDKESCLPEDILEAYTRNQAEFDALMNAPKDKAWQARRMAVNDFMQTDPTAKIVMEQAAHSNFERFHLRGCFLWALVTGGHTVRLVLPILDEDRKAAGKEHKADKKMDKRTDAQGTIEADKIDNKTADIFKNASRIAPGIRAQISRNALERILPGIGDKPIFSDTTADEKGLIANQEFVIKASAIANRANAFFFFSHPNVAKRRAQNKYQTMLNDQWVDLTTIDVKYTWTTKVRKAVLKNVPDFCGFSSTDGNPETLSYRLFSASSTTPSSIIKKKEQQAIVKGLDYRKKGNRSHAHFLASELRGFGFDVKILKTAKDCKGIEGASIGDLWVTAPFATIGTIENQCFECVCDRFMPSADEPEEMVWTLKDDSIIASESLELVTEFSQVCQGLEVSIEDEIEYEYTFEFEDDRVFGDCPSG